MGLLANPFNGNLKRQWRRRKYKRLNSSRKNVKLIKFGGNKEKRSSAWKIRAIPKLRLKFASPLKLWTKFKNAYMTMMLRLAGNVGGMNNNGSVFGGKRIPKGRQVPLTYKNQEFENRLIYEIYKSLVVSMELNPR
ncbi:hypothetical protein ACH5RR_013863 [Cinchona calisaya]|uniref:Uncharacterized protein n=1 Tax=Cinchona calisaya TaxID=153742 RepID=A0ABD3A3J8_9GENT